MIEADELLDLVNDDDKVIGTIRRGDVHELFKGTGHYVRYACVLLQNDVGLVWVPKRTARKTIAPGGLDFAAAEHVKAGETYFQAAQRGLSEELNLHGVRPQVVGKLSPDKGRPYFSMIHRLRHNESPTYNHEDFVSFEWLEPAEVITRLEAGIAAKDDLLPAIKLLLSQA